MQPVEIVWELTANLIFGKADPHIQWGANYQWRYLRHFEMDPMNKDKDLYFLQKIMDMY